MRYRLIFIGTGEFAVPILDKLAESEFKPKAVITEPDKPVGRKKALTPLPIKRIAQRHDIKIFQPEKIKSDEAVRWVKEIFPDLIVVADYGQVIPKKILDIPKFGSLNVHPSLLPKYRGPSPIQCTILKGDIETGVTIILMDEKMDHGPIVSQISNVKCQNLFYSELLKILADAGAKLLLETLPKWLNNKIKPMPQNESEATYTKILVREEGKINWQKSAKEIERQIRAFEKWPQNWCEWQTKNKKLRIKILKAKILHPTIGCAENQTPGFVFLTEQKEMAVNCNPGSLIIEELQLEGRKKTLGKEFLRGYPKIINSILF